MIENKSLLVSLRNMLHIKQASGLQWMLDVYYGFVQ